MSAGALWSAEDAQAAEAEGWALFDSHGSVDGPLQLQRFDDPVEWSKSPQPYPFESDVAVWHHVRLRAQAGSPLHVKALRVLELENPQEHQRVSTCNSPHHLALTR